MGSFVTDGESRRTWVYFCYELLPDFAIIVGFLGMLKRIAVRGIRNGRLLNGLMIHFYDHLLLGFVSFVVPPRSIHSLLPPSLFLLVQSQVARVVFDDVHFLTNYRKLLFLWVIKLARVRKLLVGLLLRHQYWNLIWVEGVMWSREWFGSSGGVGCGC